MGLVHLADELGLTLGVQEEWSLDLFLYCRDGAVPLLDLVIVDQWQPLRQRLLSQLNGVYSIGYAFQLLVKTLVDISVVLMFGLVLG